MCTPKYSHLIQEETKSITDKKFQMLAEQYNNKNVVNTASFDLVNLDTMVRL